MGLVMQEPIMREFARRNQIAFKDADYALYHPREKWMASHFDYISEDGKTLYEVKNLGVHQRKKYGDNGSQTLILATGCSACMRLLFTRSRLLCW
jgi:hypothetical protein